MELLKKYENIKLDENTFIHKEEHSFIQMKNNKEEIIKGTTVYTIIDKTGKREPKEIQIKEN